MDPRRSLARPASLLAFLFTLLPALLLAPAPPPAAAADPPSPAGDWTGALQVGGGAELHLVFHVAARAEGGWSATMDSPDQGARGIPVDEVAVSGDSVRIVLAALRAGFRGVAAGDSLRGVWEQGGFSLPLALGRGLPAPKVRPQDPVGPLPYQAIEVVVPNRAAGIELAGTLTEPQGAGPFPALVLVTGSGPENRDEEVFDHRPFRVIADRLTRHGFAVLRLDDRGVGRSTGSYGGALVEDFVGDARAALAFLAARPDVDRARIGILGHSEGGMIADLAAVPGKGVPPVAFVVMLAGPGVPGDSLIVLQTVALLEAAGQSGELVEWSRAFERDLLRAVCAEADTAARRRAMERVIDDHLARAPEAWRGAIPRSSLVRQLPAMLSPAYRSFLLSDPRPALRRLRCPVLAMNGTKDVQVPARENLAAIAAALKPAGNPASRAIEMPGLNHLFQTAQTGLLSEYGTIEETMAPAALDTLTTWLEARAARGPQRK
jgi:uncharacterized protein